MEVGRVGMGRVRVGVGLHILCVQLRVEMGRAYTELNKEGKQKVEQDLQG